MREKETYVDGKGCYGRFTDGVGIAVLSLRFSRPLNESVVKMEAEEDIDHDRLGVGHLYTGYENGEFVK